MRIDIEKIMSLLEELHAINKEDISNIELYENGSKIEIPSKIVENWKFIGLNNTSFIEMRFWENEDKRVD